LSTTVVLGAQWGDEGKGKVTDFFASSADYVVRFQGGNNAGHTIVVGKDKIALSLTPSGVLYPDCTPVIGSGCVVDLGFLKQELEMLKEKNISTKKLVISPNAHLIMPYHKLLDELIEESLGENKIGTTKKGIGPCYADKIQRKGIRVQDLLDKNNFEKKVKQNVEEVNLTLTKIYNQPPLISDNIIDEFSHYQDIVSNHIADTSLLISNAIKNKKTILFEGAQGTLLDIDHGTYPFVTSSNTTAGGACTGSGVSPRKIDNVTCVAKAYTTRVGSGPFITENQEFSDRMHGMGREFGATTGRKRRCGWFDAVLVRHACRLNGADQLAVTNVDGLDGIDTIKICTSYELRGETITTPPANSEDWDQCIPNYVEFSGWENEITAGAPSVESLPARANEYLDKLSELCETPIKIIGVGPDRKETLFRD